ncbi:ABC transporter ATP-binding protein [Treponema sp. OMZ 799]|uniref:ATP-binding cassette domain-containing protein n=2 Tax=unclassified Treponema TaxID=2638727 RepID=UPI0020A3CA13|nr:ABC transporter ATP-binding protein [Treponema sp. OMZ 799]UTC78813.1 ABC transporter ATP-binding protein [Treponema sp. OMZ 799]
MKKLSNLEKLFIFFALLFLVFSVAAVTVFSWLGGKIADAAVSKDIQKVIVFISVYFVAILVRAGGHGFYSYFFGRFKTSRLKFLRQGLFHSWVRAEYEEFYNIDEGKKLSYYQQQLPSLNGLYYQSFYGMGQILMETIFASGFLLYINLKLALVSLFFVLITSLIPQLFKKILDKKQSESISILNGHMGEFSDWLKGFEVIKNYGSEGRFQNLLNKSVERLAKKQFSVSAVSILSRNLSSLASQLSIITVVFYGVYLIYKNELSIAEFMMANGLIVQLKSQVYYISMYVNHFIMSKVIFDGYKSLVVKESEEKKIEAEVSSSNISFDDVSYAYSELPVLQNVNKKFTGNGIHIIYGESGSGKSTAMKILLGLLKPKKGNVLLDEKNICSIKNRSAIISFLAQEAVFFDDSLKNNLTLGEDIAEEKIFTLMEKLGLEKFANAESLNMDFTHIENKFSGGELKRLSFVRTLLRDTPVVIFDEPFANIDAQNIGRVEDLILGLRDKKVFIVTHQLNDRIKEKSVSLWKIGR